MTRSVVGHPHSEIELIDLREEFMLWRFDVEREGTPKEWAEKHGVHPKTLRIWANRPEFVQQIEEFRKTYRDEADQSLQNLIRFSHSPEPRVALPAIKILVEVMGYTQPVQVEVTAKGMSLMDYLAHIGQKAAAEYSGPPAVPSMTIVEGSFTEEIADPWETADEEAA